MALGSSLGTFSVERTVLNLHPLLAEDKGPTFGTSPLLGTQQVTLEQRWSLWTLWITCEPTRGGWRQGWCHFISSLDVVVSVVVCRWVEDRKE